MTTAPIRRDSTWGYYIEALGLSADVLVGTTIETGNEIAARTDGEVKEIEAEIAARERRGSLSACHHGQKV